MEAYRDQYATLFNNGRRVVVLGVSVDPDTALHSWARDASFPMLFASDPGGAVGRRYGSFDAKNELDDRSLYVIAPDGRIAYRAKPFRQLSADAYAELGAAVDRVSGTGEGAQGS
ncbi:MAG: redoxin domain-containing protein [Gemmatimonadaceae bacterium]